MEEVEVGQNGKRLSPAIIVTVLVLTGIGFYLMSSKSKDQVPTEQVNIPTSAPEVAIEEVSNEAKEFTVVGGDFKFDIKEIRVKKGDTVKIVFKNSEGMHDWVVDEFDARTNVIKAGEEESVTFIASEVGTFEYYCSVGQHRKMGMVGKLIVE